MHTLPPSRTVLASLAVFLLLVSAITCGCVQDLPQNPAAGTPAAAPPGGASLIRAQYSPGEIIRICTAAEQDANASFNAIAAIPPDQRTPDNTLLAFDRVMTDYSDAIEPSAVLMSAVYPDASIAAEGMTCRVSSDMFTSATYSRRDLYDAIRGTVPRTPDEARLFNVTARYFEHNGLALPDDRLARVNAMRANLSSQEAQFMANLNNDNTTLEFTADDLAGVLPDSMAGFNRTPQGTYLVPVKSAGYSAVMTYADRSGTRKTMYAASQNQQAWENTALLENALDLRHRIAQELGYATWADYQLDGRMAKNTGTVMAFLSAMKDPLKEKSIAERADLLAIKRSLDPAAAQVDPWDISYLQEKQTRMRYAYNEEEVREYFPLDGVLQGMFGIYGSLFGIRFDEIPDAPVWDPEVRVFRVANLSDNATVGYLYFDPYPRQGKGEGYFEETLIAGRLLNGTYTVPVAVIVGNFPEPEGGKPSLLNMYEVETLFHESGHAMHSLLTRAPYGSLSGTRVEWDFVETPSQAMEEWVWDPQVMESLSGHYTNTSMKIPADLIDRIIASRMAGSGLSYSSTLAFSLADMRFHTADSTVNTTAIWYQTYEEAKGMPALEGTHLPAQFGHVMDGYDAGYYGYLWSKVYALAILDEFQRDGMENQTTGRKFRQEILGKGNMEDGTVLLENFLGREPGVDALYTHIGINVSPTVTATGAGAA